MKRTIGTNGEGKSWKCVLAAHEDDDDDEKKPCMGT